MWLDTACAVGHPTVISALRSYLPDLTLQDGELRNALMVAILWGHQDKAMLLLEYYSLNLPLLLSQKDAEGLMVNDYCERYSAVRIKDRINELTHNNIPTRVIVFNTNARKRSPFEEKEVEIILKKNNDRIYMFVGEYICQKTDGIYEVPQNESKTIKKFKFLNIYIKDEFKKCL